MHLGLSAKSKKQKHAQLLIRLERNTWQIKPEADFRKSFLQGQVAPVNAIMVPSSSGYCFLSNNTLEVLAISTQKLDTPLLNCP